MKQVLQIEIKKYNLKILQRYQVGTDLTGDVSMLTIKISKGIQIVFKIIRLDAMML